MRALVFGGGGLLGRDLVPVLRERKWEARPLGRADADVTDAGATRAAVAEWTDRGGSGWIVNLAAFTDVDGAEGSPEPAFAVNRDGAENVARAARAAEARLLHLSTDYVFDGRRSEPYPPDARPSPLNVYGRSKLEGEEAVEGAGGRPLIVRASWLYGAGGRNFVDAILVRARRGEAVTVVSDQRGRPTWSRSLAGTLAALMERDAEGILHAADGGEASWWDVAREAYRLEGVPGEPEAVGSARFRTAARRPGYSVLDTSETERLLGEAPPHWTESLARYLESSRSSEPAPPLEPVP